MANGIVTGYWEWFRKGEQTGEWTTYDKAAIVKVTKIKPKAKK